MENGTEPRGPERGLRRMMGSHRCEKTAYRWVEAVGVERSR